MALRFNSRQSKNWLVQFSREFAREKKELVPVPRKWEYLVQGRGERG